MLIPRIANFQVYLPPNIPKIMNINVNFSKFTGFWALIVLISLSACKSSGQTTQSETDHKFTNNLIHESSPYLLQHAHNPVNWYPWGEEALAKAKAENKMLIISVGYAACHWCHVMEHESFEDTIVAKMMNDHFVAIKVDREERPDIDDVYMTACQLSGGRSCGWPLNVFALPDGRPVWAGTYFPKDQWMKILGTFSDKQQNSPQELEKYASQLTQGIQSSELIAKRSGDFDFTEEKLDGIFSHYIDAIDFKEGGRKGAPKFPMPNNYDFLLRYFYKTKNTQAFEAVDLTLTKLAMGGIYDQIGGGFARYSTDGKWKVPHFEKMLYDNGQLISLYSQMYSLTNNPLYKDVIESSLTFVERELTDKSGGFYSSLDADSDGEEGKYYVWKKSEIDSILGDEKIAAIFNAYYEVTKSGNWERGNNILYRRKKDADLAAKFNITEADLKTTIHEAAAKLLTAREARIHPGLDDKILTAWNALMLKGYVDAYKALDIEKYRKIALQSANFISSNAMDKDFRLNRNFKNGKSSINAFLDDYALTIQAFTALYEITFDEQWLQKADGLTAYTIAHFYNEENGFFNYTSDVDPALIARKQELSDNVIPGSNSSMARALFTLGSYLYKPEYIQMAGQMLHNVEPNIVGNDHPTFFSNWCILMEQMANPPYEVAILGEDYENKRAEMMAHYLPNAVFLGGKSEGSLELLKDKLADGVTMIYVCQDKVCKLPVQEVDEALKLMK